MLDRKALDAAGDNAPYHQRLPISGDDGWVGRIAREQLDAPRTLVQFLDRKGSNDGTHGPDSQGQQRAPQQNAQYDNAPAFPSETSGMDDVPF